MLTRRGLHIRHRVLARAGSSSTRPSSLSLARNARTDSQVKDQPRRPLTHSAVRSEAGSIPIEPSALSGLKGKADEVDGRPEHAVISTFDLFSIGGT